MWLGIWIKEEKKKENLNTPVTNHEKISVGLRFSPKEPIRLSIYRWDLPNCHKKTKWNQPTLYKVIQRRVKVNKLERDLGGWQSGHQITPPGRTGPWCTTTDLGSTQKCKGNLNIRKIYQSNYHINRLSRNTFNNTQYLFLF